MEKDSSPEIKKGDRNVPPPVFCSPEIALIDAIGPFFRGIRKRRVNWSKIPFSHLDEAGRGDPGTWSRIRADFEIFLQAVQELGFNSITLDDLPHLSDHPWFEAAILEGNAIWRTEFRKLSEIAKSRGLRVFVTCDFLTTSPAVDARLGGDSLAAEGWFCEMLGRFLNDFPQVDGVVLRIGESDGLDVRESLRSRIALRSADEVNRLLKRLLPVFERHGRLLIFRTWTVGAYLIGDLIWHRARIAGVFRGIDSPALVVSMKYGESDFFRFLPLNRHFFRLELPKIIEFQARREYEGAGEYPSFVGWDAAAMAAELSGVKNLVGYSVWCQTGGWHRFRRLAFLEDQDIWIRLNAAVLASIFGRGDSLEMAVGRFFGEEKAALALEFLRLCEETILKVLYVEEFASQKLFFRRVRIPPLLHVYWDCLFINEPVRRILRHFVRDPEHAIRSGEAAMDHFPRILAIAEGLGLPVEDLRFMRDSFQMICLARRYYFLPDDPAIVEQIEAAKREYKLAWPRTLRPRYRIKTGFGPTGSRMTRMTFAWVMRLLIRRRRGYRTLLDRVFTLNVLSRLFFFFRVRHEKAIPKFLRKTAMGIDSLFR